MDPNTVGIWALLNSLLLVLGLVFIITAFKKREKEKRLLFAIGTVCIYPMVLFPAAALLRSENLMAFNTLLSIGILFLLLTFIQFLRNKKCNHAVTAETVKIETKRNRHTVYKTVTFRYHYEGKEYVRESFTRFPPKKADKLFSVGASCTVFIDPDVPTDCTDKRYRPIGNTVFIITTGSFFILLSFVFLFIQF